MENELVHEPGQWWQRNPTGWALMMVFGAFLTGCAEESAEESSERATPVTVATAERGPVQHVEIAVGRLQADSAPRVAAEISGRVTAIHADAGDAVAAGDPLAELDPEPWRLAVNSAAAEVTRLEAVLANQRVRTERLRNLAGRQSVSEQELEAAETEVQALQAQLEEARSRVEDARYNLERARIHSPVDGRIQQRMVSAGDYVSAGTPLFELVDSEHLRAVLPLPERLQERLREGLDVYLSRAGPGEDEVRGRVSEIRPAVGGGSRAVDLIVELDNPGGWRPGGSVTGRVVLAEREGVTVPLQAVIRRPGGRVVYRVDDGRAVEQIVETGVQTGERMEITAGLEGGDRVAVDGAGFLTDGARVQVSDPEADGGS